MTISLHLDPRTRRRHPEPVEIGSKESRTARSVELTRGNETGGGNRSERRLGRPPLATGAVSQQLHKQSLDGVKDRTSTLHGHLGLESSPSATVSVSHQQTEGESERRE